MVTKAQFRVVREVIKAGQRREQGYVFTAGVNGQHVTRWLKEGRIERVKESEATK